MPMESDLSTVKQKENELKPNRLQNRQLKDLNDQIESEITAYRKNSRRSKDEGVTHRSLRIRPL